MVLILLAVIGSGACYKWGDWKNWRLYYPTILFYIIGDLTHEVICQNNTLWLIKDPIFRSILADYFISFIIAPSIIILFLSNYPKRIIRQVIYILCYVGFFSIIEYIGSINKSICYYNGWSFIWTVLLYIGMFPIIRLHYKKPLSAWLTLYIMVCGGIFYFRIQL